jgi:serine/threonine protein kinase
MTGLEFSLNGGISQTNVLVDNGVNGPTALIADFEQAGELRTRGTIPSTESHSARYIPPEVVNEPAAELATVQGQREKADIYSLGLTVYEV